MGSIRDRFARDKTNDWVDWLKDDEPPEAVQAEMSAKKPRANPPQIIENTQHDRLRQRGQELDTNINASPKLADSTPSVSIHISLPELHLPKVRIPYRHIGYWTVVGVIAVGVSIGARGLVGLIPDRPGQTATQDTQTTGLSFDPVAPADKPELASGKTSQQTAYNADKQLYSYTDTYLEGTITVSQQPLPSEFKANPDSLQTVAAAIGATSTFETAFGKAYVATSSNETSQRLVFIRRELLISMESTKKYDNDAWKLYIESLR